MHVRHFLFAYIWAKKTCARGLNDVLLDQESKEELGRSIIKTKTGSRRRPST